MKKSLIIISMLFCACGGGGGSDGDSCQAYCDYSCGKIGSCFNMPGYEVEACRSSCMEAVEQNGRSEESCDDSQIDIQNMTCADLAVVFGLARTKDLNGLDLGRNLLEQVSVSESE